MVLKKNQILPPLFSSGDLLSVQMPWSTHKLGKDNSKLIIYVNFKLFNKYYHHVHDDGPGHLACK